MKKKFITVIPGKKGNWIRKNKTNTTEKPTAYSIEGVMLNLPKIRNSILQINGCEAISHFTTIGSCIHNKKDLNSFIIDAYENSKDMTTEQKLAHYSEYMQLICYSVSGFSGLSTTAKETCKNINMLADLVSKNLINTEANTPIYLYQYEVDGKKIISTDLPAYREQHKDVQVFNLCSYQLPSIIVKDGIAVFEKNYQTAQITQTLSDVFNGKDKFNDDLLTNKNITNLYINDFHRKYYIKDGLANKMIIAKNITGNGNKKLISALRSISIDENDLFRTLAYSGFTVEDALNSVKIDEKIKHQIYKHAQFVLEKEPH